MKNLFLLLIFLPIFSFCQININGNLLEINWGGESQPKEITKAGNKLLFTAVNVDQNLNSPRRLYVKNPLNNAAQIITVNNNQYSSIKILGCLDTTIYFVIQVNNYTDKQLWKTDGTSSGTLLVKNIDESMSFEIENITFINNKFFFMTTTSGGGYNLWSSDGTSANTAIVGSFPGYHNLSNVVTMNGHLVFAAQNASNNPVIIKSNGTTSGTQEFLSLPTNVQAISTIFSSDNYCYFVRIEGSNRQLFKIDSNGNMSMVKQLQQYDWDVRGGGINNKFLFFAKESVGGETQSILNSYDEITNTITTITNYPYYYSGNIISFENKLYYESIDGSSNYTAIITDGTSTGTKTTMEAFGVPNLTITKKSRDSQYLILSNSANYYVKDRTPLGIKKITKESDSFSFDSQVDFTYYDNNNIVFSGTNNNNGTELFVFNNSESSLLEDINHSFGTAFVSPTELNGKVVFFGNNLDTGQYEPAISDGTISGTKILKDINPGGVGSVHYSDRPTFFKHGNKLYFRCRDGNAANEPCVTDGTEFGTKMVKKLGYYSSVGSLAEDPYFMSLNDNEVLFAADGNTNNSGGDFNLWKTDGTEAGTMFVHSVYPAKGSYDHKIASAKINGFVYFTGQATLNDDLGIWKTDGTTVGTQAVKTFTGGPNNIIMYPKIVGQYNNKIFIYTIHWSTTSQLYVLDVTTNTATLLQTASAGNFYTHMNKLYFTANEKITTLNMDNLQFSESTYNTGNINDLYVDYSQCGSNLFVNIHSYSMYNSKLYLINDQVNQPIALDLGGIQTSTCIDNRLLYVARIFSPSEQKVIKITDGINFTNVNFFHNNQNLDLNYHANAIFSIFKTQDKLFFYATAPQINNAGAELYLINDWNQFLNIQEASSSHQSSLDLINVYPNPSSDFIKIKSSITQIIVNNVSIFDMSGRQILIAPLDRTNKEFEIKNLINGVYLIKVTTDKGVFYKKFIKK